MERYFTLCDFRKQALYAADRLYFYESNLKKLANCKQYFVLPDLNFEYFSHVTLGFGTIFTRNLVILHTFHTVLGDLCILLTVLYLGIVHTFNILINVKIAILQGRFRCLRSQR